MPFFHHYFLSRDLTAYDLQQTDVWWSTNISSLPLEQHDPLKLLLLLDMREPMPADLRHAYRALLRATTYLPDSAVRTYVHNYALNRFRTVTDKIRSSNVSDSRELTAKYHTRERIGKVWQYARQLERAGQGGVVELRKVLNLTYGRAGRRRRELVQKLLEYEERIPQDKEALERLIQRPEVKEDEKYSCNKKLQALMESQRFNHPIDTTKGKLRSLKPTIPETNIWNRAVPRKLQASIKRKFWAKSLDTLLPPVPRQEWQRLRGFATGTLPIEFPPPRRSRPPEQPTVAKLLEYFTVPTNRQRVEIEGIEIGDDCIPMSLEKIANTKGMKTLTPRFMKRLYASIWSMTPVMARDEATKTWTTTWGGARTAALTGQITAPSSRDMELFEGADETVKHSTKESERKKREIKKEQKRETAYKAARKVLLGDEGYVQGAVPVIWTARKKVEQHEL